MSNQNGTNFLKWALPRIGYRWEGFSKPREQVLKRIKIRMQQLGLSGGYSDYRDYLQAHSEEWKHLDRLCDVTISKFFRDRQLWEYLRDNILSLLLTKSESDPVRVWSAGCCNGEEPYSFAIIFRQLRNQSEQNHRIFILATDRNKEVLDRAKRGLYPTETLKELTDKEKQRFFHKVTDKEDDYEITKTVKELVRFEFRDIKVSLPSGEFDIILCRNLVFTYFSEERQKQFLKRLYTKVRGNGYLVIGSNEELPENDLFELKRKTYPIYIPANI